VISRRVTIAIPIHNEQEVLPELLRRVFAVLDQTPGGPHELLMVDDGSRDGSLRILEDAVQRDPRLRVIVLSRNFGHQAAVSAAFDHATGDVMMVMDGDLQDAPEALPILLTRLDEGFDVVYVRRTRRKEPFWLRTSYHLAYRMIARLSKLALPVDAGDFALLSRRAVDAVRALPERQRYLRGLRSWVGFRQTGEELERHARAGGESKYSVSALIGLALDGTFAFSTAPLRFIGALGGFVLMFAAGFSLYATFVRVVQGRSPQGFTALTVLVTIIGGMILVSLWIIGEYVGRIYEEVKRRPIYLVDRMVGGDADLSRLRGDRRL
jgi:polyisoprenyl-phosphate glycosyltransferase